MNIEQQMPAAPLPGGQPACVPRLEDQIQEEIADLEHVSLDLVARTLESVNANIRQVLEEIR